MTRGEEVRPRVRWWSPAATSIVVVFAAVGVALLVAGRDPGGIACLLLAVAYPPIRAGRGYLAATVSSRRGG